MNRNQYYQKHQHLQLDRNELERKYQAHQRELEDQMMWEAAMRVQGAQVAAVSAGGGGGIIASQPLELVWVDTILTTFFVGDPQSVDDWNAFFDLPSLGTPFTSVVLEGINTVKLYGGSDIKVKPGLLYEGGNRYIISINDPGGCITSVGGDAFSYCNLLTSVNLPACKVIYGWQDSPYEDGGGLSYSINLVNLSLPNLNTLGDYGLGDCNSIQNIDLPSLVNAGNVSLGWAYSATSLNLPLLTTAEGGCFYNCTSLTSVSLPSLTTTGYSCFYNCTSLTSVDLPSLTTAGDNCFWNCTSLTSVSLPSCTNLGGTVGDDGVFLNITGNTITLTVPSALMTCNSGNPDGDIEHLQVSNSVIFEFPEAPKNAFLIGFDNIANADSLVGDSSNVADWNTFFDLPTYGTPFTSVEIIGGNVYLLGATSVEIKGGLMYTYINNTFLMNLVDRAGCITAVHGDAFSYCQGLVNVSMPACTVVYGWQDSPYEDFGGFGYCLNLKTIDFPSLETAGDYGFASSQIKTLNLPNLRTAGNYCFNTCTSLTSISLPSLATAGGVCFNSCTSLASISLPLLVTAGESCFSYCTSLVSVNLPLLTTAGDSCFSYCTSLVDVYLPSCTNLGGTVGDDGVFLNITGNTIALTVPVALMSCDGGNPDGDLQYLAGNNLTLFTLVGGPENALLLQFDSITYANSLVGDSSNLSDWNTFFDLPAYGTPFTGVDVIYNNVYLTGGSGIETKFRLFTDNEHLLGVWDYAGCITTLGDETFGGINGTSALVKAYFPEVTLTKYETPETGNDYGVFGGCYYLDLAYLPKLADLQGCEFYACSSLLSENLTLPFDKITKLGPYSFQSATSLGSLFFPNLNSAGLQCFAGCTSLTSISLPSLTTAGTNCFGGCTSLASVSLPSLTTAGDSCFYGCTSLVSISLPSTKVLGQSAFNNCTGLFWVQIPNLTTEGGDSLFSGCSSLIAADFPLLTRSGFSSFSFCSNLILVNLPKATSIGYECFSYCSALTYISIPACVDLGGSYSSNGVFTDITGNTISLQIPTSLYTDGDVLDLYFNNTVTINGDPNFQPFSGYTGNLSLEFDNITSADALVGDSSNVSDWNTFLGLPSFSTPFTGVTIDGNTVTLTGGENIVIMPSKFSGVGGLIGVEDQGCVAYLANDSFYDSGVVSVSLAALTTAGINCFAGCTSMISISLPLLVTAGTVCFGGCASLVSISLPLLATAGNYCFQSCLSLTSVSLPLLTTAGDGCFYGCTSLTSASLPSLATAGEYCFANCTSLVSVSLPLLTTAGNVCFQICTSLTSVSLPLLTTAGYSCFASCTSLTSISLPSLATAGYNCFYDCTSLVSVSLPSLTTARDGFFAGCTSLFSINLPSLATAGGSCFVGCTSLVSVDFPLLATAGDSCFAGCTSLASVSLPTCTNLGGTVGYNGVFLDITGNNITLTVPSALMTCNGGNPDGDIQYLQANNTVTVITT